MCVWSLILLFVLFDKECVKMLKNMIYLFIIFYFILLIYVILDVVFGMKSFCFFLKKDMLSILNWNNNSFFKIKY